MKVKKWIPWLFVTPALIFFTIFTLYPIIASFIISFQTGIGQNKQFSGLTNYIRLLEDETFWVSLKNTAVLLVVHAPSVVILSLIIAVALNRKSLKFKGIFRVLFYLPAVTSLTAYSILFSVMLKDNGLFNSILNTIGIESIGWLSTTTWSKPSIIIAMTWRWLGYYMVIFLAALQTIPESIYEAAQIDGAGKIRQFFSITMPSVKPIILFTTILSTINVLQLFVEPYTLTNKGQPANSTMTFGLYIYQNAFSYYDFGYASAIAYVVALLVVVLSVIQFKVTGDE